MAFQSLPLGGSPDLILFATHRTNPPTMTAVNSKKIGNFVMLKYSLTFPGRCKVRSIDSRM